MLAACATARVFTDARVALRVAGIRSIWSPSGMAIAALISLAGLSFVYALVRLAARFRARSIVIGMTGFLVFLLVFAFQKPTPVERALKGPLPSSGHSQAPDIFVLSIDTLRADYLGVYGDQRGLTPHLDKFAARSVVFESCYSAAPWTKPSFASLFSGLYPHEHLTISKAIRLGLETPKESYGLPLGPEVQWLPGTLQEKGYSTACFQANPGVGRENGFDRGFDRFVMASDLRPFVSASSRIGRELGFAYDPFVHPEIRFDSERLVESFLKWVQRASTSGGPMFAWLNLMEVHSPHIDPVIERDRIKKGMFFRENDHHDYPTEDREFILRAYEEEVRFTDGLMGVILDRLDQMGLLEGSIILVVSDHGEELFERRDGWVDPLWAGRRYWGHGDSLVDEVIRVPLIISASASRPGRIDTLCSLVDVVPTLARMLTADWFVDYRFSGEPLPGYESAGVPEEAEREIFCESTDAGLERRCVVRGDSKVEWSGAPAGLNVEVPEAIQIVRGGEPEVTALQALLRDFASRAREAEQRAISEGPEVDLLPETEEQLRMLGYID